MTSITQLHTIDFSSAVSAEDIYPIADAVYDAKQLDMLSEIDDFLIKVDRTKCSVLALVAILRYTATSRTKLTNWNEFRDYTAANVPDPTKHMRGLL